MILADLEATFLKATSPTTSSHVSTLAEADGVMFLCPKCFAANSGPVGTHVVIVWFKDHPAVDPERSPGPARWNVSGKDLSDLTLTPSIQLLGGGCDWHGFVSNGGAS